MTTSDLPRELPLRKRFTRARTMRDLEAVESTAMQLVEKRPAHAEHRRALARLLDHEGRSDDARHHWTRLIELDASDFEAAYHVLASTLDDGLGLEAALDAATGSGSAALRENLKAALEWNRAQPPAPPVHHVAICGVSFSGSTLMDRLLGGLPGVRSIGESHWLTKARAEKGYELIDFTKEGPPAMPHCSVCGPRCEFLTWEFRRGMAADYTDWYQRIARRLGTSVLISADKNAPKLVDLDPLLRLDALVMFKSPGQAWLSHREKLAPGFDAEGYLTQCRKYLEVWFNAYETYVEAFRPQGKVVYLSFDRFVADPAGQFAPVCAALGLPHDPGVLNTTRPGHAIGGNARAMARLREVDYSVHISALPSLELPQAELDVIRDHGAVQDLYRRLLSRSDATVGH